MPRRKVPRVSNLEYFREHFLEALREDGVICLECGGIYQALGTHLEKLHGLTSAQYKDRWGYNRKTPLLAQQLRPRFQAMARAVNLHSYIRQTRAWVKGQETIARRGHRGYAKQFRLQRSAASTGKPRPYLQKVPDATLAALRAKGMTFTQLARAVGLTRASIRRRLRRVHARSQGANGSQRL